MVDAAIIMIENAHKHIEAENTKPPGERLPHGQIILKASKEVGPPLFWSLLVITVSFIPIFTLGSRKAGSSSLLLLQRRMPWRRRQSLAITLVPVLMDYLSAAE